MIDRRAFISGLTLGLLAAPLAGEAQPTGKTWQIGYLSLRSGPTSVDEAFRQALGVLGYVEGRDISIEYRWADWDFARVSAFAAELMALKVDVIVCTGGPGNALAVQKIVRTIPIVFTTGGDPVRTGLVASLDRPGGNLTGVNLVTGDLNAKRLELLKVMVPKVARVAVLATRASYSNPLVLKDLEGAAHALSLQLRVFEVRTSQQLDDGFSAMAREHLGALLVVSDARLFAERDRVVALARTSRIPATYEWREFVEVGGLMSYGPSVTDMYRRLAAYVDKIFRGARPADLPVEQPTKFELVINLKTAKALGLTIPPSLLQRADQVIE
jgi:putative tryptophan/tyrosine transport system substrate-binding protein